MRSKDHNNGLTLA